jgi:hypothetical protein
MMLAERRLKPKVRPKDNLMKIAPVDYMPVSRIPSDIAKKDQKGSLYLNEEEFKKVKKGSGCAGCFSMTGFRLCSYKPSFKFSPFNLSNYAISHGALSYDDSHDKDRGFKTLLGWIVDTLA